MHLTRRVEERQLYKLDSAYKNDMDTFMDQKEAMEAISNNKEQYQRRHSSDQHEANDFFQKEISTKAKLEATPASLVEISPSSTVDSLLSTKVLPTPRILRSRNSFVASGNAALDYWGQ